jgi:dTDP-4-dehydrorhamnose 3,5-epimerase
MSTNIITGDIAIDDRGSLSFVNDFKFDNVKRFYVVENHTNNFIRAWHGHIKEGKYVYVVEGSAIVGAVPMDESTPPARFVLSAKKPRVLYIPPKFYNGTMNLEQNTKIIFFSTSTLEESKGDDVRQPWDKWFIWEIERR